MTPVILPPRKRSAVALLLCGLLCLIPVAYADQDAHKGPGFKHISRDFGPHRIFKLLHKIDIDDAQRSAIEEIMERHRPRMRQFMSDMRDGKKALHAILVEDNYDPDRVADLAAKQADNAERVFIATAESFAEISAVLSPEQRAELKELMESRREKWREKRRQHRERT